MSIFDTDPKEYGWLVKAREEQFNRIMRQMALSTVVRSQTQMDPVVAFEAAGPMLRLDPMEQQQQFVQKESSKPRDYDELIGAARAYMIPDPERLDPDQLWEMVDQRRQGNADIQLSGLAAAAIGVERMKRESGLLGNAFGLTSAVGVTDTLLETVGRIPWLGDLVAKTKAFQESDRWLAEVEEGLKVGFDPTDIAVRKGVAGAMAYAVPATASWRLMGAAGKLPIVAQMGSRISPLGRAAIRGLASETLLEGGGEAPLHERAINVGLGAAFGAGTEMAGYLGRAVTGAGIGALGGAIASENDPTVMAISAATGAVGLMGYEKFLRRAQRSFPSRAVTQWNGFDTGFTDPNGPTVEGDWFFQDLPPGGGGGPPSQRLLTAGDPLEGTLEGPTQISRGQPWLTEQSSVIDADYEIMPRQRQIGPGQYDMPAGGMNSRYLLPPGPSTSEFVQPVAAIRTPDGQIFTGKWHGEAYEAAENAGHSIDALDETSSGFLDADGNWLTREQASEVALRNGQWDIEAQRNDPSLGSFLEPEDLAQHVGGMDAQYLRPYAAASEATALTKQSAIIESPVLANLSRTPKYDDADVAWALVESNPGQVGVVRNVGDVGTTVRRILQDQMPNGVGPQDFRVVKRPQPPRMIERAMPDWEQRAELGMLDAHERMLIHPNTIPGEDPWRASWVRTEGSPEGPRAHTHNPYPTVDQALVRADEMGFTQELSRVQPPDQVDILVSAGRPITNQMVKEYETYGMFSGQRAKTAEGLEVKIAAITPDGAMVEPVHGGAQTLMPMNRLLPDKTSAIADDVPGLYEQFQQYAATRLDMDSIEAGILPPSMFDAAAAPQLPRLMDEFLEVYKVQGGTHYAATLRHVLETKHIQALRDLAPEPDKAFQRAMEAEYQAQVAASTPIAPKIEDLAAARDMDVERQPGTGFILVDRLSEGQLRVPVDSEEAAVEFLRDLQRETIDDSPETLYPLEMIATPPGYSETAGRVAGEWADGAHEQRGMEQAIEELLEGSSFFEESALESVLAADRNGWAGAPPQPPQGPPPPGSLGGSPEQPLLPRGRARELYDQIVTARRDSPERFGQLRDYMNGMLSEIFIPVRNLAISIDEQFNRMGVTAGNFYADVAELQNAYVRHANRSTPWKQRAYEAIKPVRNKFIRNGTLWEVLNSPDDVAEAIMKNTGFRSEEKRALYQWRAVMEDFLNQEALPHFPGMGRQQNYVSWMRQFETHMGGQARNTPDGAKWGAVRQRGPKEGPELEKDVSVIIPRYFDGFFKLAEMDVPYRNLQEKLKGIPIEGDAALADVKNALEMWSDSRMWGLDPTKDVIAKSMRGVLNTLGKPFGVYFTFDDIMKLSYMGLTTGYRAALGQQASPLIRDTPQMLMGGAQIGLDKMMPTVKRYLADSNYRKDVIARALEGGWVQRGHMQSIDADLTGSSAWQQPELRETVGERFAQRREQAANIGDRYADLTNKASIQGTAADPIFLYGKLGDFARAVLGQTGYEAAYDALKIYVPMAQNLSGEARREAQKMLLAESRVGNYQGSIQREFMRRVDMEDYEGAARFFANEVANSQNIYGMSAHPLGWQKLGPLTGRLGMRWKTFTSQTLANTAQIMNDTNISPQARAAYAAQVGGLQAVFAGAQAATGWNFMRMSLVGSVVGVAGTTLFDFANAVQSAQAKAKGMVGEPLNPTELALVGASGAGGGATAFTLDPTRSSLNPFRGGMRTIEGIAATAPQGPEAIGRFLTTGQTGDPFMDRLRQHGIEQYRVPPVNASQQEISQFIGGSAVPFDGVADRGRVYEKNGVPVVDTNNRTSDGRVPTHRLDVPSGRQPNETWEQYEARVISMPESAFPAEVRSVNRSVESLESETQMKLRAMLAAAQQQGVPLSINETLRSQERQEWLFRQGRATGGGPVTWTLTTNHSEGRAADLHSANPQGYQWIQQNAERFGLKILGDYDPGHVFTVNPRASQNQMVSVGGGAMY